MLNQVVAQPSTTVGLASAGLARAAAKGSSRARERRLLLLGVLGVDVVALVVAVVVAGVLRTYVDTVLPVAAFGLAERHVWASILVVPILLVLFWLQGRYDIQNCLIGPREYAQIAHAATYGVILAVGLSFFAGGEPLVSRSWLVLVWALAILSVSAGRFATRHFVRRLRRRGLLRTRVVIVGASTVGIALAEQFRAAEGEGIDVVGFLDEYLPLGQTLLPDTAVVGRPSDLTRVNVPGGVDEYILVPQALPHERLEEITRLMISREGPMLRLAVNSSSLLTHGVIVTQRSSVPLVTLQRARINGLDVVLKRALDITIASAAFVCLVPLVVAALARTVVRGHRELFERCEIHTVGGAAASFWLLDASVDHRLLVRGAPALLAVIAGRLSLVGPRPMPYSGRTRERAFSLTAMKPGLSGPWRLSGPGSTREEQTIQDLSYARNYSIWEDLRVLWLSLRRVARRADAEGSLLRWQSAPFSSE